MNHQIKINRALNCSHIGKFSESASQMLEYLPESVIGQLSGKNIAALIDATWSACQEAKGIQEKECVDQGFIWDHRSQKMRDIA
jgi:hypothetical protein